MSFAHFQNKKIPAHAQIQKKDAMKNEIYTAKIH